MTVGKAAHAMIALADDAPNESGRREYLRQARRRYCRWPPWGWWWEGFRPLQKNPCRRLQG